MEVQDRLMRVDEIMERLGLSRSAVYELLSSGKLPTVRPSADGRSVRVRASALDEYIDSLTTHRTVSAAR